MALTFVKVYLLLGRVALVAQRPIVVKLSRGRSVGLCVCASVRRSVCTVHCRKTADRSMGRGTFGGEFGARHCNQ